MVKDRLKVMEWNLNFGGSDDVIPANFVKDYLIKCGIIVFTEVRANKKLLEIGSALKYDVISSDNQGEEYSNQIVIMAPKSYKLQKIQGRLEKSVAPDFLHGIITIGENKVNIIGVRVKTFKDYKDRFEQLMALKEYGQNIEGPIICTGDFNSGQIRGESDATYDEVKSLYEYKKNGERSDLCFYNFHMIKEAFRGKLNLVEIMGEDNSWGLIENNEKLLFGYPKARVKNDLLLYSEDVEIVETHYSWQHVRDKELTYLDMLKQNRNKRCNKINHGYPDHARLIAEFEI